MTKNAEKEQAFELFNLLAALKPKTAPTSDEIKQWWGTTALPMLKAQALSELHRRDGIEPRLLGFMKEGGMGVIDVMKATGNKWGSVASKDATALVHKVAAMVPGTRASVFVSEAWGLRADKNGKMPDRQNDKYPDLGDHPDRYEILMFQMIHYDYETNSIMQLSTMLEILKVLGEPRHRGMWAGTKLDDKEVTTDPVYGEGKMTGRFVYAEGDFDRPDKEE